MHPQATRSSPRLTPHYSSYSNGSSSTSSTSSHYQPHPASHFLRPTSTFTSHSLPLQPLQPIASDNQSTSSRSSTPNSLQDVSEPKLISRNSNSRNFSSLPHPNNQQPFPLRPYKRQPSQETAHAEEYSYLHESNPQDRLLSNHDNGIYDQHHPHYDPFHPHLTHDGSHDHDVENDKDRRISLVSPLFSRFLPSSFIHFLTKLQTKIRKNRFLTYFCYVLTFLIFITFLIIISSFFSSFDDKNHNNLTIISFYSKTTTSSSTLSPRYSTHDAELASKALAISSWRSLVSSPADIIFYTTTAESCLEALTLSPSSKCFVLTKCIHPDYKRLKMNCILRHAQTMITTEFTLLLSTYLILPSDLSLLLSSISIEKKNKQFLQTLPRSQKKKLLNYFLSSSPSSSSSASASLSSISSLLSRKSLYAFTGARTLLPLAAKEWRDHSYDLEFASSLLHQIEIERSSLFYEKERETVSDVLSTNQSSFLPLSASSLTSSQLISFSFPFFLRETNHVPFFFLYHSEILFSLKIPSFLVGAPRFEQWFLAMMLLNSSINVVDLSPSFTFLQPILFDVNSEQDLLNIAASSTSPDTDSDSEPSSSSKGSVSLSTVQSLLEELSSSDSPSLDLSFTITFPSASSSVSSSSSKSSTSSSLIVPLPSLSPFSFYSFSSSNLRKTVAYNDQLIKTVCGNNWKIGILPSISYYLSKKSFDFLTLISSSSSSKSTSIISPLILSPSALNSTFESSSSSSLLSPLASSFPFLSSLILRENVSDAVLFTQRASKDGYLVVLTVNSGYLDLALNWVCSAEAIHFHHYILIAEDLDAASFFKQRSIPVIVRKNAPQTKPAADYGSVEFQETMSFRTEFLQSVLNAGFHFVTADMDGLWLDDPLQYFNFNADLSGQLHKETKISGGFVIVRATRYGKNFWQQVIDCQRENSIFLATHPKGSYEPSKYTEQYCINELSHGLSSQPLFTKALLDPWLFPDGKSFFDEKNPQYRGIAPAVIHNNWIVGTKQKLNRLKEWNLHSADEEKKVCLSLNLKELQQPNLFLPSSSPMPSSSSSILTLHIRILITSYQSSKTIEEIQQLLQSLKQADYSVITTAMKPSSSPLPFLLPKISILLEKRSIDFPSTFIEMLKSYQWRVSETPSLASFFTSSKNQQQQQDPVIPIQIIETSDGLEASMLLQYSIIASGESGESEQQPPNDSELFLFLDSDVVLSPSYFQFLYHLLYKYYYMPATDPTSQQPDSINDILDDEGIGPLSPPSHKSPFYDPRIFGISLMKPRIILGETYEPNMRFGQRLPSQVLLKAQEAEREKDHEIQEEKQREGEETQESNHESSSFLSSMQQLHQQSSSSYQSYGVKGLSLLEKYDYSLYKYQFTNGKAQLLFPTHARLFYKWLQSLTTSTPETLLIPKVTPPRTSFTASLSSLLSYYVPCIPTLVSNLWYLKSETAKQQPELAKPWLLWFYRYIFEKGWYSLYVDLPQAASLATTGNDYGQEHWSSYKLIRDEQIVLFTNQTAVPPDDAKFGRIVNRNDLTFWESSLPATDEIVAYDFHFKEVSVVDTLSYRQHLTPPKFFVDQCWTLERFEQKMIDDLSQAEAQKIAKIRAKLEEKAKAEAEKKQKEEEKRRKAAEANRAAEDEKKQKEIEKAAKMKKAAEGPAVAKPGATAVKKKKSGNSATAQSKDKKDQKSATSVA